MLDPVEVKDLQHCRRTDPEWAKIKARHYLEDAAACDERAAEHKVWIEHANPQYIDQLRSAQKTFADMADRYRAKAKILMGENNG